MSAQLDRDPVFGALTRPQMFAGVTYSYFVINAVLTIQAFMIFKTYLIVPIPFAIHVFGYLRSIRDPLWFDLWLTKVRSSPRVKNFAFWRCNSYRP